MTADNLSSAPKSIFLRRDETPLGSGAAATLTSTAVDAGRTMAVTGSTERGVSKGSDADFEAFSSSAMSVKDGGDAKAPKDAAVVDSGIGPATVIAPTSPLTLDATPLVRGDGGGEGEDASSSKKRYVTPKDFELLKVIGMGAFGKVLQVRNRHTGLVLAMKVISKRLLRRKVSYVENVQAERDILTRVRHPFVVTMHASFQTREKLFLVMDFLAGGELFLRIGREGVFLERDAAFYLAEIALALEHLHGLGILHRDLKPENILLGSDGHLCLTDFGLAKDFTAQNGMGCGGGNIGGGGGGGGGGGNDDVGAAGGEGTDANAPTEREEGRAITVCGTQEYMAPEMVARKGYGRAADFWSLGCVAYEMLAGHPPFESRKGSKDLFRKIMNERVKMPDGASAAACRLIKGLLNRDQSARLGAAKGTMFQVGGVAGLKQADFFNGLDWSKLERKEIDPPRRLEVDGHEDLRHFHEEFTNMTLPRSVKEMSKENFTPRRCESDMFRGFSFIQRDFSLPERPDHEYENYWNNADGDGESISECASDAFGDDLEPSKSLAAEQTAAQSDRKKRPPRKKKKKQQPLEEVPEKEDGRVKLDPMTGERRITLDEIQRMMEGTNFEEKKSDKLVDNPPTEAPKPKSAPPPPQIEKQQPKSAETVAVRKVPTDAKGAKSALAARSVPAQPQRAHQAPPQARPAAPTLGASRTAPSPAPTPTPTPTVPKALAVPLARTVIPAGVSASVSQKAPYRPAPGSWAAKMVQQRQPKPQPPLGPAHPKSPPPPAHPLSSQARRWAASSPPAAAAAGGGLQMRHHPPPSPPTLPLPPLTQFASSTGESNRSLGSSGSSDWRQHDMSPMSPRRKATIKMPTPPENEIYWPALGGDFPPPGGTAGQGKKKQQQHQQQGAPVAPRGSWAAKAGAKKMVK